MLKAEEELALSVRQQVDHVGQRWDEAEGDAPGLGVVEDVLGCAWPRLLGQLIGQIAGVREARPGVGEERIVNELRLAEELAEHLPLRLREHVGADVAVGRGQDE